jgi:hypothetical protein
MTLVCGGYQVSGGQGHRGRTGKFKASF